MEIIRSRGPYTSRRTGAQVSVLEKQTELSGSRAHLTFYTRAPTEDITLDQLERFGVNRLTLLKQIELIASKKEQLEVNSAELHKMIQTAELDAYSDRISHFILRLAFCKTEELRNWLATLETHLFRMRFVAEDENIIEQVIADSNLDYKLIRLDDMSEEEGKMVSWMPGFTRASDAVYYRMPFEQAWELLRGRQVACLNGMAYVSKAQLGKVLATKFRIHLKEQLALTYRHIHTQQQDTRVMPIMNALGKQFVGSSYKSSRVAGQVSREQIPTLVEHHFPLCMSELFEGLRTESHLRHGGRMQLGLFLKGIGITLEDSLIFWRQMFSRRTPEEKFNKQYAYNIRHNYGKEGKRTDYTPYSCVKIISSQPGPGDHVGCPFRHYDEQHLRLRMRDKNVRGVEADEIVKLVEEKHYQIACKKFFAATHGGQDLDEVGNHPNAYFDASLKLAKANETEVGKPILTSPTVS